MIISSDILTPSSWTHRAMRKCNNYDIDIVGPSGLRRIVCSAIPELMSHRRVQIVAVFQPLSITNDAEEA